MASASTLVELGERYAALGLLAAARGALARALAAEPDDPAAARRLAELELASGRAHAARDHARVLAQREPGPAARVLLGRTQLAAGELAGARFSFAAALEAGPPPLLRARAHLGRAQVAAAEGDPAGATANVMAGVDAFCEFAGARDRKPDEVDAEIALAEELLSHAVDAGRADDAAARIDELAAHVEEAGLTAPIALLRAVLLAARASRGDREVGEADVEAALAAELDARPTSRAARLRLIERKLRRRYRDKAARADAIEQLERTAAELAETSPSLSENLELARVYFLLAAAYEDDPGHADRAEDAYRKGLALRPGHAAAASRLALLTLARGDREAALAEIERALRIDAGHGLAWRNAARVLDASSPGPGLPGVVERLLDAAHPGAGSAAGDAAPHLLTATAEVARGDVLAGMYTRGHRLKNLLGIIGSRARSARKLASSGEDAGAGDLVERLADLEREVTALYDEWTGYLRSMRSEGAAIEVVPVAALIAEVVEAARARTSPAGPAGATLGSSVAGGLPDLRGDRMLLREALLNIVSNAVEACTGGGQVDVTARAVTSGGTPVIEIEVADTGAGIPRADVSRVFAPGFTTKETGSGVGLAIAERVIAAHHGRILLETEEGEGTRVTVVLPSDLGGFAALASFPRDESDDG